MICVVILEKRLCFVIMKITLMKHLANWFWVTGERVAGIRVTFFAPWWKAPG
jgi:hypothetical protein